MVRDFRIVPEAARVDPEWAVIASAWNDLDPDATEEELSDLTPGQRAIFALHWVRAEVQNGGFHQCFWNPAGGLLPDAAAGAVRLGSQPWSDLVGEALRLLPSPYPRDWVRRRELLEQISEEDLERMTALDDRLFDLDDDPETALDEVCRRYIEGHPEEFFVPALSEEDASAALLQAARELVNEPPPRRLDLARALLGEAANRSRTGGTGRVAALAESLIVQLPDLST